MRSLSLEPDVVRLGLFHRVRYRARLHLADRQDHRVAALHVRLALALGQLLVEELREGGRNLRTPHTGAHTNDACQ